LILLLAVSILYRVNKIGYSNGCVTAIKRFLSKLEMKNLSDLEVIESVKKGNVSDYSIIIDRYKNKAFSLLNRMLKNSMEAEEVLQDCFIKAFNSLGGFREEAKFSTWFYRIVYNTALTKLSAKKRKIESEMSSIDEHINLESKLNIEGIEQKDIADTLQKLISELPSNYAAVITMFYLEGMSCEEISQAMNLSVSNVKVMLHRSRNALREAIMKKNYLEELL
jgi:RNA polymerase sigma-70 factor (ECF subfamily)